MIESFSHISQDLKASVCAPQSVSRGYFPAKMRVRPFHAFNALLTLDVHTDSTWQRSLEDERDHEDFYPPEDKSKWEALCDYVCLSQSFDRSKHRRHFKTKDSMYRKKHSAFTTGKHFLFWYGNLWTLLADIICHTDMWWNWHNSRQKMYFIYSFFIY